MQLVCVVVVFPSSLKESKWFPGIAFYIENRNLLIDIAHQVSLSLFFSSHGFFKEKLSPTISSTRDASQQLAPPGPSTLWCRMVLIMIKPRLVPTSWRRTILQRPTFSNANCSFQLISTIDIITNRNNPSSIIQLTLLLLLLKHRLVRTLRIMKKSFGFKPLQIHLWY